MKIKSYYRSIILSFFIIALLSTLAYPTERVERKADGSTFFTNIPKNAASQSTLPKTTAVTVSPLTAKKISLNMDQKTLYWEYIKEAAEKYDVEPSLILAVIRTESNFKKKAKSNKGAMGLMQLMPGTAKLLGVKNAYDPQENILGGTCYLRMMIDEFHDIRHALAAYNAGPEAVRKYKGIPPYRETQNYVASVLSLYKGPYRISNEYIVKSSDTGRLVFTNIVKSH